MCPFIHLNYFGFNSENISENPTYSKSIANISNSTNMIARYWNVLLQQRQLSKSSSNKSFIYSSSPLSSNPTLETLFDFVDS